MYLDVLKENQGGFNFDLCLRNTSLIDKNVVQKPKFTSTGTTICGILFKDGVILAADTRATAGPIVADKNVEKLHKLAPNIYVAGAGTAADNDWVTKKMQKELELLSLNSGRQSRVSTAVSRLQYEAYRYGGNISAYLIIGGYDCNGGQLVSVSADGVVMYMPFVTLGSGSLNAISVLEAKYKDDLSENAGIDLVCEAIEAGILHDLGYLLMIIDQNQRSGSNVDIVVLKKDSVNYMRNYKTVHAQKLTGKFPYSFPKNNTPFFKQISVKLEKIKINEDDGKMQIE